MKILKLNDGNSIQCEDSSNISTLIFKCDNFTQVDELIAKMTEDNMSALQLNDVTYSNVRIISLNAVKLHGSVYLYVYTNIQDMNLIDIENQITELQEAMAMLIGGIE